MSYYVVTISSCLALAALSLTAPLGARAQDGPLDPLVRLALQRNLGLRQQQIAAERVDAAVRQARGGFLPGLTLDARYSEMHGGLDFGDLVNPAYQALNQLTGTSAFPTNINGHFPYAQETRARLVQPVYNPAIIAGHRASVAQRGVQDARTQAAARQLAAQVQLAYVGYAKTRQLVAVVYTSLALVREHVRVTERLLANGKLTPDAVFRARAEQSAVQQQLADAEQKRAAALHYLNYLLDQPADAPAPEIPDSALVTPLPIDLAGALQSARKREELTQIDHGIRAARAQQSLARSINLPSVSLALDYGFQGSDYHFDTRADFAMASVVVQWNLLNGLQDGARREQAGLEVRRAQVQRTDVEHQVELEVRQAFEALQVGERALATADAQLQAARRSYELTSRRFQEGLAAPLDLLDARTAYTNADINQVLTRCDYAARYIELERAAALRNVANDLSREK